MNQGHIRPSETRKPKHEVLPDGRMRITRFHSIARGAKLVDGLILAWGTADVAPVTGSTSTWATCRLVGQSVEDGDTENTLIRIYEELPATDEQLVGAATKIKLEDGRDAWEFTYLQFTAGTYVPGTVSTTTAPGNANLYLKTERAEDDGTLRTITRQFVAAGTIAQDDEEFNNGALLKRTITSVKTVPSTPSGYILVGTPVQAPGGLPVYTYTYWRGTGQIAYDPSSDNNDKLLRLTIRHLTAPSASNPISTPGGYTLVSGPSYQEATGHRIWTAGFAKGDGEISRTTDRGQNGTVEDGTVGVSRLTIDYLTAPAAAEPTWASVTGYTKLTVRQSARDGHLFWSAIYAKGAGTVNVGTQIRSMGKLKVYNLVGLGAAPTAPTATLGGTVTLFDTSVRQADGYIIYDYRWSEAEPDGRVGISTTARTDGSLVYNVTELGVAVDTPAYPGSGTAYRTFLDNNASEGHYVNRATYIKPPATATLRQEATFPMPGTAQFETVTGGHNLLLAPAKQQTRLASVEVSYSTTQDTTAHYSLLYGTTLRVSFIRDGSTTPEFIQERMPDTVASSDTVTGTDDTFNGMLCASYSATLTASSPTTQPSGATLIAPPRNEIYLTAIDGTVVYRITKVSVTF